MRVYLIALFALGLLINCIKNENCGEIISTNPCYNASLIDSTSLCTEEWNPVCGCDGITYSNACYATTTGITSWSMGECCH
jgi:hypothetical protein